MNLDFTIFKQTGPRKDCISYNHMTGKCNRRELCAYKKDCEYYMTHNDIFEKKRAEIGANNPGR